MTQGEKNKQFMYRYFDEMRAAQEISQEVFRETMHRFIEDPKLIQHIAFFKKSFPKYDMTVQEIIGEGERVFIKVNFIGKHAGSVEDIPATHQEVEVPFALCYTIRDEKIVDFWAIANEMEFFEQLGMNRDQVEVPK